VQLNGLIIILKTTLGKATKQKFKNSLPIHFLAFDFSRVALPGQFVRMVIGRLRSDDLYNATR